MVNQDVKRETIVQSARDLFSRFGFRKTTMDDIALSMHDIPQPGWAVDPGAQIDDLVVDTGRGTGQDIGA